MLEKSQTSTRSLAGLVPYFSKQSEYRECPQTQFATGIRDLHFDCDVLHTLASIMIHKLRSQFPSCNLLLACFSTGGVCRINQAMTVPRGDVSSARMIFRETLSGRRVVRTS